MDRRVDVGSSLQFVAPTSQGPPSSAQTAWRPPGSVQPSQPAEVSLGLPVIRRRLAHSQFGRGPHLHPLTGQFLLCSSQLGVKLSVLSHSLFSPLCHLHQHELRFLFVGVVNFVNFFAFLPDCCSSLTVVHTLTLFTYRAHCP